MSPLLEAETQIRDLRYKKFVRDGNIIAYGDATEFHSVIAEEHRLGEKYKSGVHSTILRLLDDAGRVDPVDITRRHSLVSFVGSSKTYALRRDEETARQKTIKVAKSILGENKVAG